MVGIIPVLRHKRRVGPAHSDHARRNVIGSSIRQLWLHLVPDQEAGQLDKTLREFSTAPFR